jgi:hypothetical protein
MVRVPWLLGSLFEHDTGAQTLQGLDRMALPAVLLLRVQVRVALLVIIGPLGEQMIPQHQNLMRDGHRRFLLAQAPFEAPECPPQKRRRFTGRPGTLAQEAPHVPMAGAGASTPALPRTVVVARRDARPCGSASR